MRDADTSVVVRTEVARAPMEAGIAIGDDNFDSFNTSYSDHREQEGGKGLGRFTWLKAFERVEIDSTFIAPESSAPVRRNFVFDEKYSPDRGAAQASPGRPIGTSIYLIGLKEPCRSETAKTGDKIVQRLVEHFLLLFLSQAVPRSTTGDEVFTD